MVDAAQSSRIASVQSQHLTKSRYIAGLQCLRRLWLLVHEPPAYEEPAPGSPLDIGQEIGRKARLLFPGGVLVGGEPWQHAEAAARTAALMADARVPAIFEAAFEHDGIRIRVDVLERLGQGTWGLREVKSSTGLRDHHVDEIALQAFVLAGAGVTVRSIELLHVNTDYVRGADGICWPEFFARLDVGEAVADALVTCPTNCPRCARAWRTATLPHAEPGEPVQRTVRLRVLGPLHDAQACRLDLLSPAPDAGQERASSKRAASRPSRRSRRISRSRPSR